MMPDAAPPPEAVTVAQLQAWGRTRLAGDEARRESELLLGHALQRDRAWLFAHAGDAVETPSRARFAQLVAQRERGVPVAQLLGRWGFWTLDLEVTADTLVPRPETELLVEAALARLEPQRELAVADLGTGTGAIALALAQARPRARVLATDASPAALAVARRNAASHGLPQVEFRLGDWYAPLQGERFDLIASNPPYLADDDPHLEALRFEPSAALSCGPEGLEALRTLARGAPAHLHPRGWLLVEHGLTQGPEVRALFAQAGLEAVETLRDLEGRERVTLGRRADAPLDPARLDPASPAAAY
jgi:release factor glutamine methyltransferase